MTKNETMQALREMSEDKGLSLENRAICDSAIHWLEKYAQDIDALVKNCFACSERLENSWVDAKEKLPEAFVSVLGYVPSEAPFSVVHECYVDNGGVWHGLAFYGNPKVTHWMPMPEGPV